MKRLRLDHAPEGCRTIKTFAKWVGVGNGTIDRIEKGTDFQVSTIVAIASKFGFEPWHLFIAGVTPTSKPKLLTPHEMDFYLKVERLMEDLPKPVGTDTGRFAPLPKRTAERRRKRK